MRYLVLSDLHANLEALEAVLAVTSSEPIDRVLVLGDIVGYGPDPNAVTDRIRALASSLVIRGNHDKVASGVESADDFNPAARAAARWTIDTLTPQNRAWLGALPTGPLSIDQALDVCHGSPDDEDEYIFEHIDALEGLRALSQPVAFFGHTHVRICYWMSVSDFDVIVPPADATRFVIAIEPGRRYLINPGSVGQPRDGDARAAYAVFDSDAREVTWCRASYDVATTQAKIIAAGLPDGLARRLADGR